VSTLSHRLEQRRIVICAGSGGVGKTTTSAAIALGLAVSGARVAVVTIDPARRLADALGLDALGDEPARVDPARFGDLTVAGELWAMMLDPKRTFDTLIAHLAPDQRTRDEILANRIYQQLSSAVAGSQEFTAIAKLWELHRSGRFDAIVLDTPPSRNALDFLDAPDRLVSFLDGRALRLFLAPSGLAARVMSRGTAPVFALLQRVTGTDLLRDLQGFFGALGGVIDGFRERAEGVGALLSDPATTFLVVTSPEREPAEEAIFFREQLRTAGLPFGALIVNRVHPLADDADRIDVRAALADDPALAARGERSAAELHMLAERDAKAITRLSAATGDHDPILVPQLAGDVHDVEGLVAVHRHLFAGDDERAPLLSAAAY
jgi:anion-transporting  ArsA/GET3 family ATPase